MHATAATMPSLDTLAMEFMCMNFSCANNHSKILASSLSTMEDHLTSYYSIFVTKRLKMEMYKIIIKFLAMSRFYSGSSNLTSMAAFCARTIMSASRTIFEIK